MKSTLRLINIKDILMPNRNDAISAFSCIFVHKSVVVITGNRSLDVYILIQDRPLNAIWIYTLNDNNRLMAITKDVTRISTLLCFMPNCAIVAGLI
jgi:hypothetical protein